VRYVESRLCCGGRFGEKRAVERKSISLVLISFVAFGIVLGFLIKGKKNL